MKSTHSLETVKADLATIEDLTAFAQRHKLPLRTVMHIKSPATTSARASTLEKIGKALAKAKKAA